MIKEQIKNYGVLFRNAIQSMPINEFPKSPFFDNFPTGCCGDTSNLFAKFLSSKGFVASYVWGLRKEQSHAWLEYKNIIIDLTADQFPEVKEKVIVTANKAWHYQFRIQKRSIRDFETFEEYNANRLGIIYRNILSRLEHEEVHTKLL
ncbi:MULTISPECIES: hypothetical protein [unclassified Paenibacillus]|uniref:hypothetical protein n=1 Tax=unclassified Paenibacillus TaxID=185978 RepID=UPI00362CBC7C